MFCIIYSINNINIKHIIMQESTDVLIENLNEIISFNEIDKTDIKQEPIIQENKPKLNILPMKFAHTYEYIPELQRHNQLWEQINSVLHQQIDDARERVKVMPFNTVWNVGSGSIPCSGSDSDSGSCSGSDSWGDFGSDSD